MASCPQLVSDFGALFMVNMSDEHCHSQRCCPFGCTRGMSVSQTDCDLKQQGSSKMLSCSQTLQAIHPQRHLPCRLQPMTGPSAAQRSGGRKPPARSAAASARQFNPQPNLMQHQGLSVEAVADYAQEPNSAASMTGVCGSAAGCTACRCKGGTRRCPTIAARAAANRHPTHTTKPTHTVQPKKPVKATPAPKPRRPTVSQKLTRKSKLPTKVHPLRRLASLKEGLIMLILVTAFLVGRRVHLLISGQVKVRSLVMFDLHPMLMTGVMPAEGDEAGCAPLWALCVPRLTALTLHQCTTCCGWRWAAAR
jgi:hypothetical protein